MASVQMTDINVFIKNTKAEFPLDCNSLYLLFGHILSVFYNFDCGTVLQTGGGRVTVNANERKVLGHWAGMIHWSHDATL